MKRTAGMVAVLLGGLVVSCGKMDQERPLLSEEERKRHNAPLEGKPCALPDSGLLSGSVPLGEENYPVNDLRTHVDDCGNLVAGWFNDIIGGVMLLRVLRSGELDWKAPFPYEGNENFYTGPGVNDIASDQAGSLFVATQHTLLGFTAAGERQAVSTAYPKNGWSFIERLEDVRGDDEPSSGTFIAGPVGYTELALPSGHVFSQGSGGRYDGPGRVESAPLSTDNRLYFPEAELVVARGTSVPQGGLVAPLVRLAVERVQVSYDKYQSPGRTVVFEQDFDHTPYSFSLASRGGEYALALTPGIGGEVGGTCTSAVHWISRDATFELEGCPGVLDSLFTQDGSYWSLWTDREPVQSLRLFRWEPGASTPREVALDLTGIWTAEGTQYSTSASLAKTPQGTVVVTAFSSDLEELRFVEVDGGE